MANDPYGQYAVAVTPSLKERGTQANIEQSGASAASSAATAAEKTTMLPYKVRAAARKEQAAVQAETDAQKRAEREVSTFRSDAQIALDQINKLRNLIGPTSVGYGAALQNLPGSKAKEVAAAIKQLQSNKFFIQINEMKQQGGKGGTGIGRILQSEIPMFVNKWGTLDQTRDARGLGESLNVMENQIRRMYARVNGADLDNQDPKVRYQVEQQYGIRPAGTVLQQPVVPPLFKAAPETGALGAGSKEKMGTIPQAMQDEYEAYVGAHLGNLDPEDYAKFRAEQATKYGFADTPEGRAIYKAEAQRMNVAAQRGTPMNLQIQPPNVPASEAEQARAEALASPVTGRLMSAAVGAANQFTSDLFPSAVAAATGKTDEEVRRTAAAYESAHPGAAALGRFAGGVGQVAVAPGLYAKYGIPLMTAQGAVQGAVNNPDDRLAGAMQGAGINLALGTAGTGVSALARGAKSYLPILATKYGVPLTTGELLNSPTMRYLESKLAGLPGVGTGIANRMEQGRLGVNEAAFRDALKDIGGPSTAEIGQPGVQNAYVDVNDAYDASLRGVRVPVTPQYRKAVFDAIDGAGELDPQYASLLDKELAPLLKKRVLNGNDIQQVLIRARNVSSVAKDANGAAWKNYVLPHIQTIENATTQAVEGVAPDAAAGLTAANNAYRKVGILSDAVSQHLDEDGIFTPQTLLKSVANNVEAFEGTPTLARGVKGKRELPLFDLASEAANKKRGLLGVPGGPSVAAPVALATLGGVEAAAEGAMSPEEGHTRAGDFGTAALRNAGILAAAAAAPRVMYATPMQNFLQRALTQGMVPKSRAADILAKYLPAGVTGAFSPAAQYTPPVSVGARNMPVAQLPGVVIGRIPRDLAPTGVPIGMPDEGEPDVSDQNAEE